MSLAASRHPFSVIAVTSESFLCSLQLLLQQVYKRAQAIKSAWTVYLARQKLFRVPTIDAVISTGKHQWEGVNACITYYRSEHGQYDILQRVARPVAMLSAALPLIIVLAIRKGTRDNSSQQHQKTSLLQHVAAIYRDWFPVHKHELTILKRFAL